MKTKKTIKKQHLNEKQNSLQTNAKRSSQRKDFYLLLIILLTFIVFFNARNNNFTNWDDDDYVIKNPYVWELSSQSVKAMFSVYVSNHYHPLTLLSLAIDYKLWGRHNAKGFITTNIILHILNALLVFLIFVKIFKRNAWALMIALVFAIHPMKVESVVWVAERKDVLYAFFYLLAILTYLYYITSGFLKKHYIFTLVFALLALLSKASAASLPLILLLFDFLLQRKNYRHVLLEKIPFFALSLVFGIVAIKAQSTEAPNSKPFFEHLFLTTYALAFYIVKFFAPLFQTPLYEFPEKLSSFLPLKYYLSFAIIPLWAFLIYKLKTIRRELIFGFGFFGLSLILVLIKFPIGPAYLTERYTYLPYIGLAYLLIVFYRKYLEEKFKIVSLCILLFWIGFLCIKTFKQNGVWKDSVALWTHVLKYNPNSAVAYNNRGDALYVLGTYEAAIADYNNAILLKSEAPGVLSNRGNAKKELNDFAGALADYDAAIKIQPQWLEAYFNRALTKEILGDTLGALNDFSKVIEINTYYVDAYYNRGNIKYYMKDYEGALQDYNTALTLNPKYINAYNNRAVVFYMMGNNTKACADWQKASGMGHSDARRMYDANCQKK